MGGGGGKAARGLNSWDITALFKIFYGCNRDRSKNATSLPNYLTLMHIFILFNTNF